MSVGRSQQMVTKANELKQAYCYRASLQCSLLPKSGQPTHLFLRQLPIPHNCPQKSKARISRWIPLFVLGYGIGLLLPHLLHALHTVAQLVLVYKEVRRGRLMPSQLFAQRWEERGNTVGACAEHGRKLEAAWGSKSLAGFGSSASASNIS